MTPSSLARQRWRQVSEDPNAPAVYDLRREVIAQAKARRAVDRIAYLCDLVCGKSMLDIGVVEHTLEATASETWLHGHLRRHARTSLGIDVHEAGIEQLKKQGYNVELADITAAPLSHLFEIIVAGEVIEHIDSPGKLMENCAKMLAPGGRLVITTPNPWHANAIYKNCFSRHTFVDSADHVAWYDAATLFELGHRCGLLLDKFTGFSGACPRSILARIFFNLKTPLVFLGISSLIFSKSIVYEFVKRAGERPAAQHSAESPGPSLSRS